MAVIVIRHMGASSRRVTGISGAQELGRTVIMRFAVIATTVASMVGVPLAVSAVSPQMNSAEFLSAVQCLAYENAASPNAAELGTARWRLNAEASKQPAEVAALARAEARAVSAAVGTGAPVALACSASRIADGARDHHTV